MRMLFVSHTFNNPDAGASRVYHQLTDALKGRGHEITTLHLNDLRHNWRFAWLAAQFTLPFMVSKRAAEEALHSFDVIMSSNGMLYPLFKDLKRKGSPVLLVNHLHGLNYFDHQAEMMETMRGHTSTSLLQREIAGRLPSRWDILGCRYADLIIVQNNRDRDFLSERGISPIVKIPLSVHPRIREAAQQLPKTDSRDPNQLLWFGSWITRKGAHYLPLAFELILARCPGARLIVGGTGLPIELLRTRFNPSLLPKIEFLSQISIDEHITILSRSAILLFPSLSEGFGYALLEAMSMGVAVVTTQTGMGGDYLKDEHSALIVPFGSAVHLANAAIRLIDDPEFRSKIAKNGQLLSQHFNCDRFADEYQRTFSDYLNKAIDERPTKLISS